MANMNGKKMLDTAEPTYLPTLTMQGCETFYDGYHLTMSWHLRRVHTICLDTCRSEARHATQGYELFRVQARSFEYNTTSY